LSADQRRLDVQELDKQWRRLGHHDGKGPNANRNFSSWNTAHTSKSCSQPNLVATGGVSLFYCFAAD